MSGHSKWSKIKRSKGVADAAKGQIFTKLGREITVVVRQGGSDPDANYRLRLIMQKARAQNMPMDNIDRAIKRAAGEGEGSSLDEVVFEGYGPGGVGLILEAMTDNRNRTAQEMRSALARGGGSLGEPGSVSWLFETRGVVIIEPGDRDPEEIGLLAIDSGAEDVKVESDCVEVYTKSGEMRTVSEALEKLGLSICSAEISRIPKTMVELDEEASVQVLKLIDRLEALDDVQRVYSNADFADAAVDAYQVQAR